LSQIIGLAAVGSAGPVPTPLKNLLTHPLRSFTVLRHSHKEVVHFLEAGRRACVSQL